MRESLLRWIGDADALRHMNQFGVREVPLVLGYQETRKDDLYIALVGELFDYIRNGRAQPSDWAQLGNAIAQFAVPDRVAELKMLGVAQSQAALFSAAAFYFGGFPASACLTMRSLGGSLLGDENRACFDLLARPHSVSSPIVHDLVNALLRGDLDTIERIQVAVLDLVGSSLQIGPNVWIPLRVLESLVKRFRETNLRAVLPKGQSSFWTPLVSSFVHRGTWDFFPSQIEAINRGLLDGTETFSLQMPTGAGKTALCETLLFSHLKRNIGAVAVLIVPYRSLASELRGTLVKRLNEMGISARCAYGGTVPSGDEVHAFDETRALIATPETLSGILSANAPFANRISLVICDEGHLLDAPSRGVGLELLLARMKLLGAGVQRFIFVSAIVPNIEEINLWLGGCDDSVVRSDYRPAIAEFSVLRPAGRTASSPLNLEMHPHEAVPLRYKIEGFLRRGDFQYSNVLTGRIKTYPFSSVKTRAIAAARKALPMGASVVFAANKRGGQGAIGLAGELINQLENPLSLPKPLSFADGNAIDIVYKYLEKEYGADWVGTRALRAGAVLHHGDIPQETREIVERMLRDGKVKFAVCTSTLAEGVNLPIRTLVLYSVQRVGKGGVRTDLLTRDIKNLVGRAGRAGSTIKGLVICANQDQWPLVAQVAQQAAGESVVGALRKLIMQVRSELVVSGQVLTNEVLEATPIVHSLIDGIDATIVDLAATEIGEDELVTLASSLADQTFAASQLREAPKQVLRDVFILRARRVVAMRTVGRLDWLRETGARVRMIELVESNLLPMRQTWDDVIDPLDPSFVNPILRWAWAQHEMKQAVREAYRIGEEGNLDSLREPFFSVVRLWLSGASFIQMAEGVGLPIDDVLGIHSHVITYAMQTIVEQAIALLEKILQSQDKTIAPAVFQFPEHLRFGVPRAAGCVLAAVGVHHRCAYVALGNTPELFDLQMDDRSLVVLAAQQLIEQDQEQWRTQLGTLVFENTVRDLSNVVDNQE